VKKKTNTTNKIDETTVLINQLKEVDEGLSNVEKSLPSKYFMIKQEMLFYKKIMHLPEYYVTRSEHEIFKTQSETIIEALQLKHLF
jgi:uncharacterized SAM-dependent methyltransferase